MAHTQITALWNGFPGAPGYSRFNFSGSLDAVGAGAAADKLHTFFTALVTRIPNNVSIEFPGVAQIFDGSGVLTGEVAFTNPTPVDGTASGSYSGPSGAVVNWLTSVIRNGRRFKGRTYLVPLSNLAYESDGSLSAATRTMIQDAADALLGGAEQLCIFGGDAVRGYATAAVDGALVPDRAAVLRSRRAS